MEMLGFGLPWDKFWLLRTLWHTLYMFLDILEFRIENKTNVEGKLSTKLLLETSRAQRDSIRSQTFPSIGTAYDITKYETFLTKYGIVCPFDIC